MGAHQRSLALISPWRRTSAACSRAAAASALALTLSSSKISTGANASKAPAILSRQSANSAEHASDGCCDFTERRRRRACSSTESATRLLSIGTRSTPSCTTFKARPRDLCRGTTRAPLQAFTDQSGGARPTFKNRPHKTVVATAVAPAVSGHAPAHRAVGTGFPVTDSHAHSPSDVLSHVDVTEHASWPLSGSVGRLSVAHAVVTP